MFSLRTPIHTKNKLFIDNYLDVYFCLLIRRSLVRAQVEEPKRQAPALTCRGFFFGLLQRRTIGDIAHTTIFHLAKTTRPPDQPQVHAADIGQSD